MISLREAGTGFARNLLMGGGVFLPVFIFAMALEMIVRGVAPLAGAVTYEIGGGIVVYLSMVLPTSVGVLVYSIVLWCISFGKSLRLRRLLAFVLSPLVPSSIVLPDWSGGALLTSYFGAAATATVAYGIACASFVFVDSREVSQRR